MSFDARSLERLQALGRQLPQPLPQPAAPAAEPPASARRHRVETETDPQALFRELMQVSADGSVPPHLMERLRQAEADQREREAREQRQRLAQRQLQRQPQSQSQTPNPRTRRPGQSPSPLQRRSTGAAPIDDASLEMYSAFQQLLLEGDEDGD
jgi:hypothetical protein